MAQNGYDMTGVLHIKTVTPVIRAIFCDFDLDEKDPGGGQAYVSQISESNNADWDNILEALQELAIELELPETTDELDCCGSAFMAIARYLGVPQDDKFRLMMGQCTSDYCEPDLESLVSIAMVLDDGHGLSGYTTETAWYCSKPRLFEFGGQGAYCDKHVSFFTSSNEAGKLGKDINDALASADVASAARAVEDKVLKLVGSITSETERAAVLSQLIASLVEKQTHGHLDTVSSEQIEQVEHPVG